ncbi:MAG: T9SS type A sorting domain-containing protein [Aureispira sp.]
MKIIFTLAILMMNFYVDAQIETFNKRITVGCSNTVLTGLEVTDSCYYMTGSARNDSCIFTSLFMKRDLKGDLISYKISPDTDVSYQIWQPSLRTDIDGNLLVTANAIDSNTMRTALIKYTPEGNVLWRRLYEEQAVNTDVLRNEEMIIAPDSSYILVGQTNSLPGHSFQIMNVGRDGNIIWSTNTDCQWNYCVNHSVWPLEDGFVVGYSNSDANLISIDYTQLTVLMKYDYQGNELWTWNNDSSIQLLGANHLIQTKDKGWVVATALGEERLNSDGVSSRLASDGYVFKLDSNRNMLWQTPLRAHTSSPNGRTIRLIELEDSSLMTFGMTADTLRDATNTLIGQYSTLVAKLSSSGDSLWARKYHYFQQSQAYHEVFDTERTADGGFLICGQAEGIGEGVYQQGWLLKLDEHGCLVPGCHIPDTITSILPRGIRPQIALNLYPNPVTDYLNVLYRNEKIGKQLTFRIIGEQGQVIKTYTTSDISDKTYVFPIWKLLSGWYVLEIRQDGKSIASETFIKK